MSANDHDHDHDHEGEAINNDFSVTLGEQLVPFATTFSRVVTALRKNQFVWHAPSGRVLKVVI